MLNKFTIIGLIIGSIISILGASSMIDSLSTPNEIQENSVTFGIGDMDKIQFIAPENSSQSITVTGDTFDIKIITPDDHGCQLSLIVPNGVSVFNTLSERGVVCDWREPDVIRFAPHPLFNTYLDIFNVVKILEDSIDG